MEDLRRRYSFVYAYYTISIVFFIFINNVINAQTKKTHKPDVKIRVNKETDEYGNIIKYDSVYFYSWSNFKADCIADSVLSEIERFFNSELMEKKIDKMNTAFPKLMNPKLADPSILGSYLNEQLKHMDSIGMENMFKEFFNFNNVEGVEDIIKHQKKMMDEFKKMHMPPHSYDTIQLIKAKPKYIKPIHYKENQQGIDI